MHYFIYFMIILYLRFKYYSENLSLIYRPYCKIDSTAQYKHIRSQEGTVLLVVTHNLFYFVIY